MTVSLGARLETFGPSKRGRGFSDIPSDTKRGYAGFFSQSRAVSNSGTARFLVFVQCTFATVGT
jgi:hypothetical protein